jgi:hypothetical protein
MEDTAMSNQQSDYDELQKHAKALREYRDRIVTLMGEAAQYKYSNDEILVRARKIEREVVVPSYRGWQSESNPNKAQNQAVRSLFDESEDADTSDDYGYPFG